MKNPHTVGADRVVEHFRRVEVEEWGPAVGVGTLEEENGSDGPVDTMGRRGSTIYSCKSTNEEKEEGQESGADDSSGFAPPFVDAPCAEDAAY